MHGFISVVDCVGGFHPRHVTKVTGEFSDCSRQNAPGEIPETI